MCKKQIKVHSVCIHEAGHAIAALNFKCRVKEMNYSPEPESGKTQIELHNNDDENRIIALAGIVATSLTEANFQAEFDFNLMKNFGGEYDCQKALSYSNGVVSIEQALNHEWDLLRQNKDALIRLAESLGEQRHLTEDVIFSLTGNIKRLPIPNLLDDNVYKNQKRRSLCYYLRMFLTKP